MTPDSSWLDTLTIGQAAIITTGIAAVYSIGMAILRPLAKRFKDFFRTWNAIQYETRDFQNELVQQRQAMDHYGKTVFEALKRMEQEGYQRAEGGWVPPRVREENEVKFVVESGYGQIVKEYTEPVTYPNPYVADQPQWMTMADRIDEGVDDTAEVDSENEVRSEDE